MLFVRAEDPPNHPRHPTVPKSARIGQIRNIAAGVTNLRFPS